jgi:glycosyltransferase involved in cell wall biosynthesis
VKLVFLNQSAGVLFRELAEDCARALGGGTLITGMRDTLAAPRTPELSVLAAPPYDRRNLAARAKSWLAYFFSAAARTLFAPGRQFAFIVSNPPFLGILGVALRLLRGDRYAVLVYDLYPDLLENYGKVRPGGFVALLWRWFNRVTWERADAVFTLGNDMAERMKRGFDPRRTRLREILIVPPWADVSALSPTDAANNPFRKAHARADQAVVLYSGNFGITHDL